MLKTSLCRLCGARYSSYTMTDIFNRDCRTSCTKKPYDLLLTDSIVRTVFPTILTIFTFSFLSKGNLEVPTQYTQICMNM